MDDNFPVGIEGDLSQTDGQAGGRFSKRAEALLSDYLAGAKVLLTTSCTAALEMAAILSDIHPGDVAVVPSYGFVTTALAFVRSGANIRFADIEDTTLGLDPESVAAAMDDSVKAVVPVHYGGLACEIETIRSIAESSPRALVIEDNAHGLFGSTPKGPLGTLGEMAALSFHSTKNVSCGEGGALVVNDTSLADRAQIVLEKGTDRRDFLRGVIDKYVWRDIGSSFGLSDYLAAILCRRLARAEQMQKERAILANAYDETFLGSQATLGFRVPVSPREGSRSAHHLYYLLLSTPGIRDDVLSRLRAAGVEASSHFVPLHSTPGGKRWSVEHPPCPVSERVASSIIRLPLRHDLKVDAVEHVANETLRALKAIRRK